MKTGKSNSLSLENVSNGRPPARARSRTTPNPPPVRGGLRPHNALCLKNGILTIVSHVSARKPEPPQKTPAPESARKPVVVPTPSAPIQPAKTEDDKTQIVDGESTWDVSAYLDSELFKWGGIHLRGTCSYTQRMLWINTSKVAITLAAGHSSPLSYASQLRKTTVHIWFLPCRC